MKSFKQAESEATSFREPELLSKCAADRDLQHFVAALSNAGDRRMNDDIGHDANLLCRPAIRIEHADAADNGAESAR